MVGTALAVLARRPDGLRWIAGAARPILCCALVLLAWLGFVRHGFEHAYEDPVMAVVSYPVIARAWGALLVLVLRSDPRSRVSRLLSAPSLVHSG